MRSHLDPFHCSTKRPQSCVAVLSEVSNVRNTRGSQTLTDGRSTRKLKRQITRTLSAAVAMPDREWLSGPVRTTLEAWLDDRSQRRQRAHSCTSCALYVCKTFGPTPLTLRKASALFGRA